MLTLLGIYLMIKMSKIIAACSLLALFLKVRLRVILGRSLRPLAYLRLPAAALLTLLSKRTAKKAAAAVTGPSS
jgi:hypothetical protein